MVYVTRHHKALKVTNREFHVLRYLPQQVGRILFLHLVYIREVTTVPNDKLNRAKHRET